MNGPETFGTSVTPDALVEKQKHDISTMRSMLLSCDVRSAESVKAAMNNILVMRVYHQISRIIKYTEEMDKIEEKLYNSIDANLTRMQDSDSRTLLTLLSVQERLQKIMIDSHKLLEPYLSMDNLTYVDVSSSIASDSFTKTLLDQDSRERLRSSAQAILLAIDSGELEPAEYQGADTDGD